MTADGVEVASGTVVDNASSGDGGGGASLEDAPKTVTGGRLADLVAANEKDSEAEAPSSAPTVVSSSDSPRPSVKTAPATTAAPKPTPSGNRQAIRNFDFGNTTWNMIFRNDATGGQEQALTFRNNESFSPREPGISDTFHPDRPRHYLDDEYRSSITWGDIDGDGYEDAVVRMVGTLAPYGIRVTTVYTVVWLWDPQRNAAVNMKDPVTYDSSQGSEVTGAHIFGGGKVQGTWSEKAHEAESMGDSEGAIHQSVFRVDRASRRLTLVSGEDEFAH